MRSKCRAGLTITSTVIATAAIAFAAPAYADNLGPGNWHFNGIDGDGTPDMGIWEIAECGEGCLQVKDWVQFRFEGDRWIGTHLVEDGMLCPAGSPRGGQKFDRVLRFTVNADGTGGIIDAADPVLADSICGAPSGEDPETFFLTRA